MDNIIIDNQLINKEQITKIRYEMKYDKASGILYTINPFLCYFKDEIDHNHKKYIRSNGRWNEENMEGKESKEMLNKIKKAQMQTDFIRMSGYVYAYIELSSGTEIKVNIFKFKREVWFDCFRRYENVFPIKEELEGIEFKPEDINIEYISDLIFKGKKYKETKKVI